MLCIGILVLLLLGVIYAWSVFVAPLEAAFGWQRSETGTVFTISLCFFCLGGIPGGIIAKRKGAATVLRLSALCMLLGFSCAAFFATLPAFFIGYGCFCGLGVGLGYNAVLGCVIKYFPDKPGFCNGCLLLAYGCGALVLSAVCTSLMNALGWKPTFYLLAVAFALILFLCAFFLRVPESSAAAASSDIAGARSLSARDMLKKPSFYFIFGWMLLFSAGGMAIIGNAAPMAVEVGAAAALSTLVPGVISVCNGFGRLLEGSFIDRLGWRKSIWIASALNMAAFALLTLSFTAKLLPLFVAGCALLGLGFGSIPVMGTGFVNAVYGQKHYGTNIAVLNLNILVTALIGPQLTGLLYVRLGSYVPVLFIFLAYSLLALVFAARLKDDVRAD